MLNIVQICRHNRTPIFCQIPSIFAIESSIFILYLISPIVPVKAYISSEYDLTYWHCYLLYIEFKFPTHLLPTQPATTTKRQATEASQSQSSSEEPSVKRSSFRSVDEHRYTVSSPMKTVRAQKTTIG